MFGDAYSRGKMFSNETNIKNVFRVIKLTYKLTGLITFHIVVQNEHRSGFWGGVKKTPRLGKMAFFDPLGIQ